MEIGPPRWALFSVPAHMGAAAAPLFSLCCSAAAAAASPFITVSFLFPMLLC